MDTKISEYTEKEKVLRDLAFTQELKDNALVIDVEFNYLQVDIDYDSIYSNGEIIGITVDLNDHNKEILSKFICDFEAYDRLIDLQYSSGKKEGQTDLISIIDFIEEISNDRIFYDRENEYFSYKTPDLDDDY